MRKVLGTFLFFVLVANHSLAYLFNFSIFRNPDSNQVIVLGGDEHNAFPRNENQQQFETLKLELKELQPFVPQIKIFVEGYPHKYGENGDARPKEGFYEYAVETEFGKGTFSIPVLPTKDSAQSTWLGNFFHDFHHNSQSWPRNISAMSIESRFDALNLFFGPREMTTHLKLGTLLDRISIDMYVTATTNVQRLTIKRLAPYLKNLEQEHENEVARFLSVLDIDVAKRHQASNKSLMQLSNLKDKAAILHQCEVVINPRQAFFARMDHALLSTIVAESGSENQLLFFFVGDAHKRVAQDALVKAKFIEVHSSPRDKIEQMYGDGLSKQEIDKLEYAFWEQLEAVFGV